ncbi:MAG TPA: OmpA family protein [Draconibacterium sp.]|nr:OmpA family protein [Draconibacterium sp.]
MKTCISVISICVCFILFAGSSTAQINLRDKIKNQTNNRANNKADQGVSKSLDKVEEGINGLFKKDKSGNQQQQQQTPDENQTTEQSGQTAVAAEPSLQSYSKFDFIPGEKVIYYEDFSQDAVGDFPALWNTNGSAEVVTTNLFPGNWLQVKPQSYVGVWTDEPLVLPENYTMEFDIIPIAGEEGGGMSGYNLLLYKFKSKNTLDGGSVPGESGFWFKCEYYGTPRYRAYSFSKNEDDQFDISGSNDEEKNKQKLNQKSHISIWVQKTRLRLYINENKVFDLPRGISLEKRFDRFRIDESAVLISNLRIAVGAPDMRNKLMTDGKLVTYGIYFDVNKDVVKPESYGTLKEIAKILNEVPDVKVKILGHTDADGQDAANLDLSKRRAASVKAELAKSFGVNADRLETDGMGETQPVAPNDTPVNKALNRRVEFVKL